MSPVYLPASAPMRQVAQHTPAVDILNAAVLDALGNDDIVHSFGACREELLVDVTAAAVATAAVLSRLLLLLYLIGCCN